MMLCIHSKKKNLHKNGTKDLDNHYRLQNSCYNMIVTEVFSAAEAPAEGGVETLCLKAAYDL